jgi:Xaa-Pro aminopeptidase
MAKPSKIHTAKLLYECGANWRYAVGEHISDPALWYQSVKGVTHAVVNELEYGHLTGHVTVDKLHSFGTLRAKLKGVPLSLPNMLQALVAMEKTSPAIIEVPRDFPAGLYQTLRDAGLPLQPSKDDLFFPARAIKTAAEIKKLRTAQALNEAVIQHGINLIAMADVAKDGKLFWQGKPLTSEIMQTEMNARAAKLGALSFSGGPIVAGGKQGATPHNRGSGGLRAGQFIVIDSFPHHRNGYWGDCTRTVLKGTPTDWHKQVYYTVLEAQTLALKLIKPGVDGRDIQAAVQSFFVQAGFKTGTDKQSRPFGFFHGTGHGVGLELHDPGPRTISGVSCLLKAGMVTSVEPGLYYPGKGKQAGGCRIEDVVVITASGYKNLTKLDKKRWIID